MAKKIAVAIIHGVLIEDEDFAATAIRRLQRHFAKQVPHARDALVLDTVHWAPVLEPHQEALISRIYPRDEDFFQRLRGTIKRINQGSVAGLVPLLRDLMRRSPLSAGTPNYPAARWVAFHFVGDIVAYYPSRSVDGDGRYRQVHDVFARTLKRLAYEAGPDAPLCVLAHSYGSVIASDFFYDLQSGKRPAHDLTPLERGETLTHLYTLGSPLALWALRGELDQPIRVPSPHANHSLGGEWINYYDSDDVIGYPLRGVSPAYASAVASDVCVTLSASVFGRTPLVHGYYLADDEVLRPIAHALARAFQRLELHDAPARARCAVT